MHAQIRYFRRHGQPWRCRGVVRRTRRPVPSRHAVSLASRIDRQRAAATAAGSNLRDDNALLAIDLTNPDIFSDQRIVLQKERCTSCARYFFGEAPPISGWDCALRHRAADLRLVILFDQRLCRSFEVRGLRRARAGPDPPARRTRPGPAELSRESTAGRGVPGSLSIRRRPSSP